MYISIYKFLLTDMVWILDEIYKKKSVWPRLPFNLYFVRLFVNIKKLKHYVWECNARFSFLFGIWNNLLLFYFWGWDDGVDINKQADHFGPEVSFNVVIMCRKRVYYKLSSFCCFMLFELYICIILC